MGITIHYKMVVRASDVQKLADRMEEEAKKRGMLVLNKGGNIKAWDGEQGDGIIISPDEGSEPLSLIFVPYSPEFKEKLMKETSHESVSTKRPRMDEMEFAALRRSGRYDLYTQVDDERHDRLYVEGDVFENRTGVYALVPKEETT